MYIHYSIHIMLANTLYIHIIMYVLHVQCVILLPIQWPCTLHVDVLYVRFHHLCVLPWCLLGKGDYFVIDNQRSGQSGHVPVDYIEISESTIHKFSLLAHYIELTDSTLQAHTMYIHDSTYVCMYTCSIRFNAGAV